MPGIKEFHAALGSASHMANEVHRRARDDFDFLAGGEKQWDSEDLRRLREQNRPALTMDQISKVVRVVSGSEIVNRHEATFYPRSADITDIDGIVSSALSEVYKYIWQRADSEQYVSRAFRDAAATGVGFTETYVDYFDDPDGRIVTSWVPIREMSWDPDARQQNLSDSRFFLRAHWLDEEEFERRWPDAGDLISAMHSGEIQFPMPGFGRKSVKGGDYDPNFADRNGMSWYDKELRRILVYEWQYYTHDSDWYRVYLPPGGLPVPVPVNEERSIIATPGRPQWVSGDAKDIFLSSAEMNGYDPAVVEQGYMVQVPRRQYRTMHVTGNHALDNERSQVNAFTYLAMTGFEDNSEDSRQLWQGLVRALKDPQRLLNKSISQMVHRINMSPAAFMYEEGAVANEEQLQNDINDPTKAVKFNPGGLKRFAPKFPSNPLPAGLSDLVMLATDAFPRISGVNEAYMGGIGDLRRTPASAIQSVQQQALVMVSILMDSLRMYRKSHGRLILSHVREFMPPYQIERVLDPDHRIVPADPSLGPNIIGYNLVPMQPGQDGQPRAGISTVELLKSEEPYKYDIVVDESQTSPNATADFRRDMMEQGFLQQWIQTGRPMPKSILDYMGFPPKVAAEMEKAEEAFQAQQAAALQAQQQQQIPPQGGGGIA